MSRFILGFPPVRSFKASMNSPDTKSRLRELRRRELFEAALLLPAGKRASFLEVETAGDLEMLSAVLRLIAAEDTESNGVLDRPPHKRASADMPSSIGPYRTIRKLGSGGMADVYCCAGSGGQTVAIKVMRPGGRAQDLEERFGREREILTRLHHPNVCRILDAGLDGRMLYIVMELVEGDRIDIHSSVRQLDAGERLLLFSRVLAGVEYFHREGIVHRDLKPSNILVTASSQVKILDFGIAKFAEHSAGMTGSRPTASRNPSLTLRYASPEQLNGRLSGRASDIYSLGVVLYELLTGRHPFANELETGIPHLLIAMSRSVPLVSPHLLGSKSRWNAHAPELDGLVSLALQANPVRRYRSACEFLEQVRKFLERSA